MIFLSCVFMTNGYLVEILRCVLTGVLITVSSSVIFSCRCSAVVFYCMHDSWIQTLVVYSIVKPWIVVYWFCICCCWEYSQIIFIDWTCLNCWNWDFVWYFNENFMMVFGFPFGFSTGFAKGVIYFFCVYAGTVVTISLCVKNDKVLRLRS